MAERRRRRPGQEAQRPWWPWVVAASGLLLAVAVGLALRGAGLREMAGEGFGTKRAGPELVLYQPPT